MDELLMAMGIPSAVTGFLFWWLKRHIDKKEKAREEREKKIETFMLMILQDTRANNVLSEATARAVQRIPDAKCNGDMTAALEEAAKIRKAETEWLQKQGIDNIFGA